MTRKMNRLELLQANEKPAVLSHDDELAWALSRVLRWRNPEGTIADSYLPPWLRDIASDALERWVRELK